MYLFDELAHSKYELVKDAWLLRGFALLAQTELLDDLSKIIADAPLRNMETPGGFIMSVAMTNCGELGWVSDRAGYRYTQTDPLTGEHWPAIPSSFFEVANSAAKEAGYPCFEPDACLINEYKVGARMSLHQDKNELDFNQPIVSVSLGLPTIFQFGNLVRGGKCLKIQLNHGDVMVWGGESRLRYHGVLPVKAGRHSLLGERRINLTFRKAG